METKAHLFSASEATGKPWYADVILPLYLTRIFTWAIPPELMPKIRKGIRVEVEFGRAKRYAGIVKTVHQQTPSTGSAKPILQVLDDTPVVSEQQLQFWEWMASYYCCSEGEIMIAALPAHLKLSSDTMLQFNPGVDYLTMQLSDREFILAEALELKEQLTIKEVQAISGTSNYYPLVQRLVSKGIASVWENMQEKYRERTETYVVLQAIYHEEAALEKLLNEWGRAPRQLDLLLAFLHIHKTEGTVTKKELLQKSGSTPATLDGLVQKNILSLEKRSVDRLAQLPKFIHEPVELTKYQAEKYLDLEQSLRTNSVTLLQGVTGSGKTYLYIKQLIAQVRKGSQCLYLLPEIALTSQIVRKLQIYLGGHVGVYHSRFNANEKMELWKKLVSGEISVILGARSALLLPFINLQLIIVDEEHDDSFKQQEPPPRYHARDAAIYLASRCGAKVILGSATPSFESYFNALQHKYGLVSMTRRYTDVQMPEVALLDMRLAQQQQKSKLVIAPALQAAIGETLQRKKQTIVFQNRRGYAPYQQCRHCGWIPKCQQCAVSLTFHKSSNKLHCHYCGTGYSQPKVCESCLRTEFVFRRFGTEQLEEMLDNLFPTARVARMDTDSIKGRHTHEKIIRDFEEQRIDILVGTQMVVKGLDFDHVALVAIPDADGIFRFADFRAAERAFQMIEQVSGRAGRKNEKGKVILQLFDKDNPIIPYLQNHDYTGFYELEIKNRLSYFYPPYSRLILLTCRHSQAEKAWGAAEYFANLLRKKYGDYVKGPAEPPINKIRNLYLVEILLKLPKTPLLLQQVKLSIFENMLYVLHQDDYKRVRIDINVDPQ